MGFDPFLVQVEASSEFDLDRVPPELGASMARSGVASRVGNVASGGVSPRTEQCLDMSGETVAAGSPEKVSDDYIRGPASVRGPARH